MSWYVCAAIIEYYWVDSLYTVIYSLFLTVTEMESPRLRRQQIGSTCFLVRRQLSSCCLNTRELSGVLYKFTLPSWLYHLSEAPPSDTTALGIKFNIRILKEHIRSLAVLIYPLKMAYIMGVGNGQGGLACCDSWGRRVRHY